MRFRQLGAERLTQKGQLDRRPRRGIRPLGDLATSLFKNWCAVCEVERCKVRDESREERRVGQRREDDQRFLRERVQRTSRCRAISSKPTTHLA